MRYPKPTIDEAGRAENGVRILLECDHSWLFTNKLAAEIFEKGYYRCWKCRRDKDVVNPEDNPTKA